MHFRQIKRVAIGRNHNTRTNKTEKRQTKPFLYENFAFTMVLWWERARLPNAVFETLIGVLVSLRDRNIVQHQSNSTFPLLQC